MGLSVSGIMLMNMFGIPVVGSDICGFIGDTNPELCARWHIVGSFYPFSRNHNSINSAPQEPYLYKDIIYEDAISYYDIMQKAIVGKYHLIRYYYSSLMRISQYGNSTFYKPLFFEFPDDQNAYSNITYNVMLGSSLKLAVNSD
jgi:alpha-glucosidase (family GH31 glycosyl hydrolase)